MGKGFMFKDICISIYGVGAILGAGCYALAMGFLLSL